MSNRRHLGTFKAVGDDGRNYTVDVWVNLIPVPGGTKDGNRSYSAGGEMLNWLAKGKYQVVATGVILKATDPSAP